MSRTLHRNQPTLVYRDLYLALGPEWPLSRLDFNASFFGALSQRASAGQALPEVGLAAFVGKCAALFAAISNSA